MQKSDRKIFGTLFFSIFTAVTGVGIVVPLLPVYARDLGASGLYIGLIFGAFSLSRTLFLPYFGRLSDKKGRIESDELIRLHLVDPGNFT